jgi:hypothetical protein
MIFVRVQGASQNGTVWGCIAAPDPRMGAPVMALPSVCILGPTHYESPWAGWDNVVAG